MCVCVCVCVCVLVCFPRLILKSNLRVIFGDFFTPTTTEKSKKCNPK